MTRDDDAPEVLPFGADTDEAVSAFLDGELADFAIERALSEHQARRRLEAWPGFAARVEELGGHRDALRAVPELDELTRRRLVRDGLDESVLPAPRHAPPRRPWAIAGAVAAAAALVVGIGVAVRSGDTGSGGGDVAGRAAESGALAPPRGDLGFVGDVTDPARLRDLLDEPTAAETGGRSSDAAATPSPTLDPTPGSEEVAACARELAGTRPIAFTATGTFRGAPAVLVGVRRDARTIVFVVPPADCRDILSSASR
jgi:hypothetical protein